jgi:hypothetical protein
VRWHVARSIVCTLQLRRIIPAGHGMLCVARRTGGALNLTRHRTRPVMAERQAKRQPTLSAARRVPSCMTRCYRISRAVRAVRAHAARRMLPCTPHAARRSRFRTDCGARLAAAAHASMCSPNLGETTKNCAAPAAAAACAILSNTCRRSATVTRERGVAWRGERYMTADIAVRAAPSAGLSLVRRSRGWGTLSGSIRGTQGHSRSTQAYSNGTVRVL